MIFCCRWVCLSKILGVPISAFYDYFLRLVDSTDFCFFFIVDTGTPIKIFIPYVKTSERRDYK